jgi:hypothetical protein
MLNTSFVGHDSELTLACVFETSGPLRPPGHLGLGEHVSQWRKGLAKEKGLRRIARRA